MDRSHMRVPATRPGAVGHRSFVPDRFTRSSSSRISPHSSSQSPSPLSFPSSFSAPHNPSSCTDPFFIARIAQLRRERARQRHALVERLLSLRQSLFDNQANSHLRNELLHHGDSNILSISDARSNSPSVSEEDNVDDCNIAEGSEEPGAKSKGLGSPVASTQLNGLANTATDLPVVQTASTTAKVKVKDMNNSVVPTALAALYFRHEYEALFCGDGTLASLSKAGATTAKETATHRESLWYANAMFNASALENGALFRGVEGATQTVHKETLPSSSSSSLSSSLSSSFSPSPIGEEQTEAKSISAPRFSYGVQGSRGCSAYTKGELDFQRRTVYRAHKRAPPDERLAPAADWVADMYVPPAPNFFPSTASATIANAKECDISDAASSRWVYSVPLDAKGLPRYVQLHALPSESIPPSSVAAVATTALTDVSATMPMSRSASTSTSTSTVCASDRPSLYHAFRLFQRRTSYPFRRTYTDLAANVAHLTANGNVNARISSSSNISTENNATSVAVTASPSLSTSSSMAVMSHPAISASEDGKVVADASPPLIYSTENDALEFALTLQVPPNVANKLGQRLAENPDVAQELVSLLCTRRGRFFDSSDMLKPY